jgi:hypothetical protein
MLFLNHAYPVLWPLDLGSLHQQLAQSPDVHTTLGTKQKAKPTGLGPG